MTALLKIDQAGLSAGVAGRSRTDGLATGALVTLTNTGSGTTLMRLLWAPPGDTTALSSLAVTGDPKVWTFSPTASKYGTYLVELIADQGLVTEKRERRVLVVRTPNRKLVIPALNERGDNAASLLAAGQAQDEASNNNAVDYLDATLNGVPYAGWWRAIHEMMMALDTGIAGSNLVGVGQVLGQPIGGTAGPAFPLTAAQLVEIIITQLRAAAVSGDVLLAATSGVGLFAGLPPVDVATGLVDIEASNDLRLNGRGGASLTASTALATLQATGVVNIEGDNSVRIATAAVDRLRILSAGQWQMNGLYGAAGQPLVTGGVGGPAGWGVIANAAMANMNAGTVKLRPLDTGTGVPVDGTAAQLDAIMRTVAGVQRVVSVDTTLQSVTDTTTIICGGTVAVPAGLPAGSAYRLRANVSVNYTAVGGSIVADIQFGITGASVTIPAPAAPGIYLLSIEGHWQLIGAAARYVVKVQTNMTTPGTWLATANGGTSGSLALRVRRSGTATVTLTVENAYVERLY